MGVVGCGRWGVIPFMGDGRHLWVLGVLRGCWVVVHGLGCRSQAVGFVRVVRLSIAGGGVRSHGQVVRACWFVVCGRGGDVSCAGWSSLARLDGMRVGVLTLIIVWTTTTNDDIVVVRRLVATSRSATWHLQPLPSFLFRRDWLCLLWLWTWVTDASGGHC